MNLINRPKTLEVLWKEYTSGINGSKPARNYTQADIRINPLKYSHRKVFWDKVCEWVRGGKTAEDAINKIYKVYHGMKSITAILERMAKDKKARGNRQITI